jgi:hypothetical protein
LERLKTNGINKHNTVMNSQLINITEELENKRKELENSKIIADESKE